MPDHLYTTQVTLRRANGLPEDAISNTWHFDKDEGSAGDWQSGAGNIHTRLATFYTELQSHFSSLVGPTITIKSTNPRDAKPQVPGLVTEHAWGPASEGLPAEVACCLSFKAAGESGTIAARRRGRVYIGPLALSTISGAVLSGDRRFSVGFANLLVTKGLELAIGGAGDPRLAVYSPTTDLASSIDDSFFDVEDLWVDDAIDIVRSRGAKPINRYTANVVG